MVSFPRQDTRFRVSESLARELAIEYGTPLYVLDEHHFRESIRRYKRAFEEAHNKTELVFASKANSTLAVLAIAFAEGCAIDVASEGELRAALAAGVPPRRCHLHGNNKQQSELEFALDQRVGQVVVDNFGEIDLLSTLSLRGTKLVLRLAPGVDPVTHEKISTGQADTKFGFNIGDGSAEQALRKCLDLGLPVIGFHCHVGSQLLDPSAQRSGGELLARFALEMLDRHGFRAEILNVGGGLGVRYTENDHPMPVEQYSRLVTTAILETLKGSRIDPVIAQEPGRALVAESGVTLYRVGNIKTVPSRELGTRTYVSVDGGLSDNPRPALYGARYQVERAFPAATDETQTVTVSGKHCETDKLFEHIKLPTDLAAGDILQVLCTGAYNSSMANNYNRYPRPATVLLREDGSRSIIQRRDSWEEMFARESIPEGLS
jgi:diaminopimelate decarboxylase